MYIIIIYYYCYYYYLHEFKYNNINTDINCLLIHWDDTSKTGFSHGQKESGEQDKWKGNSFERK